MTQSATMVEREPTEVANVESDSSVLLSGVWWPPVGAQVSSPSQCPPPPTPANSVTLQGEELVSFKSILSAVVPIGGAFILSI